MQSKETADLLIAHRWLMACDSLAVRSDHAIAVTGGRIVAVGRVTDLDARFEPRERISRPDHVLLPGFVNAQTHASMILLRGLPVYSPLMRWMRETMAPAELRNVSPDFVRDGTTLAIAAMLRAGITTFAGSDPFSGEAARAAAEARMRAVIGLPVSETASAWAEDAMAHFVFAERLWDEYRSSPWVSLYFALPAAFEISDRLLTHLRSVADEIDARVAMPVNESEIEVHDTLSQHSCRPL
jgi:5-methylthioadenosine/S-adenosylhomocysteine deaminase